MFVRTLRMGMSLTICGSLSNIVQSPYLYSFFIGWMTQLFVGIRRECKGPITSYDLAGRLE